MGSTTLKKQGSFVPGLIKAIIKMKISISAHLSKKE